MIVFLCRKFNGLWESFEFIRGEKLLLVLCMWERYFADLFLKENAVFEVLSDFREINMWHCKNGELTIE